MGDPVTTAVDAALKAFEAFSPPELGNLPARGVRHACAAFAASLAAGGLLSPSGIKALAPLLGRKPAPRESAEAPFREARR